MNMLQIFLFHSCNLMYLHKGLNRSAAVTMAYLMLTTTCLLDDVFLYIKSLRPHLQVRIFITFGENKYTKHNSALNSKNIYKKIPFVLVFGLLHIIIYLIFKCLKTFTIKFLHILKYLLYSSWMKKVFPLSYNGKVSSNRTW